eukprot:TRINITY_DN3468_c1_g1_i1.p1 TRINITY_DN3468_c1_g1~~TRINITY_DN3468_c1_g1_i1.p1  ORF type:complete len:403 (+),score=100.70 TRINITY_DN3468_c1_g1_i1:506-1714(+)
MKKKKKRMKERMKEINDLFKSRPSKIEILEDKNIYFGEEDRNDIYIEDIELEEEEPPLRMVEKIRKKKKKMKKTDIKKLEEKKEEVGMTKEGEEEEEEIEETLPKKMKLTVGIGWDGNNSKLLDLSCLMFRYKNHYDDVYNYKPYSKDGSTIHRKGYYSKILNSRSNKRQDFQQIDVNLKKISSKVTTLVFIVNLVSKNVTFDSIGNPYLRILDKKTGQEYCRYNVPNSCDNLENSKIMCKLVRFGRNGWKFKSIKKPSYGRLYKQMTVDIGQFLNPRPVKRSFKITVNHANITEYKGQSDPKTINSLYTYCKIYFDTDNAKTKLIPKSSTPHFNSTHKLSGNSKCIEISLFHLHAFTKATYIGRAVIDLRKDMNFRQVWIPFEQGPYSLVKGLINVSVQEI